MMDDVLQTDSDLGRWNNLEPRRPAPPPGSSTKQAGMPSTVSGGKLTFRIFLELAWDCDGELSSDMPNSVL